MDDYKCVLSYLKRKSHGTVAIFKRKDTRELFDDDAVLVADHLHSSVGLRKYLIEDRELTILSLNSMQLNRVIRDLLLILRCRVEIYEEDEDGTGFECTAKGDFTNYNDFKEIVEGCVELSELSTVMAARVYVNPRNVDENQVTAVFCNTHDMRITIAEFDDTPNFAHLSECIQIMVPRMCYLFKNDKELSLKTFQQLENALKRPNLPYNIIDDGKERNSEALKEKFLSLLFKDWSGFTEPSLSVNVLKTAIPLFEQMQLIPDHVGDFLLVNYKTTGFMHLDAAAVKALELFSIVQDDDDEPARSNGTLYGVLNLCNCDPGRRLLRNWMRRPLFDLRKINERFEVVEALIESHSLRQRLSSLCKRIPDVLTIEKKLLQKKAGLTDCVKLYQVVEVLAQLELVLEELVECHDGAKSAAVGELLLDPVKACHEKYADFSEKVDLYVDMDYFNQAGEYRIKPDVDEELLTYSGQLEKFKKRAAKLHESIVSRSGLDSIKLDVGNGFYFRVPLKDEKIITKLNVEVVEVKKSSGLTFTTKDLKALTAESAEIMRKYNNLQKELIPKVVEVAVKQAGNLQELNDLFGLVDVLVAFSTISIESSSGGYVRPELLEAGTGVFELKDCRHPVIELKEDTEYIPNDVFLHYESKNGKITGPRFAVVTGANMAGKSTFLRAAGLTVLMAQMGCFVPCKSARFSIVDGIHTRVGASDFQCHGISTFMAEMVDCAAILDAAKATSFVLVDELGRGTSTFDGFGIAWGVADHILNKIGCFCLFATHYHEMSLLKEKFPDDVVNLKVDTFTEANGDIIFLYKIVEGLAEKSFGLNIAKTLQFPEKIILDAKRILNFLETNSWEHADEVDPLLEEKSRQITEEEVEEIILKMKNEIGKETNQEIVKEKILELTKIIV